MWPPRSLQRPLGEALELGPGELGGKEDRLQAVVYLEAAAVLALQQQQQHVKQLQQQKQQ